MYRSHDTRSRAKGSRATQCGSKGSNGSYDPQVGAAATQNAATAASAMQFSQDYYKNTMAPLVAAETAQAGQTTAEQQQLFGLNYGQAKQAADHYNQYGLPASSAFYDMAKNYSSTQEANSQANSAIGDMRTAEASNQATLNRQRASYGISPTSGAAIAGDTAASVQNTAAEAAAATRARYNAKTMGMQLTADAANFSNGGISSVGSLSGTAGNAANGALGAAATATGSAGTAANGVMQGYQIATNAYGNNLSAYAGLDGQSIAGNNAGASGLGQAIGAAGSMAMMFSDRRLKTNVVHVGETKHGFPIYDFNYLWDSARLRGVMADDVEKTMPAAVVTHSSGYKMVNYAMLR